jgi:vacuolar protein sorting-associated protein 45
MVHELIGIQDNKVDLRSTGKFPTDQQVELHFSFIVHIFIFIFCIA